MLEKLQIIQQRFDEVSDLIIQPDIISDQKRYVQLNKEYKDLSKLMEKGNVYQSLLSNQEEALETTKADKPSLRLYTCARNCAAFRPKSKNFNALNTDLYPTENPH